MVFLLKISPIPTCLSLWGMTFSPSLTEVSLQKRTRSLLAYREHIEWVIKEVLLSENYLLINATRDDRLYLLYRTQGIRILFKKHAVLTLGRISGFLYPKHEQIISYISYALSFGIGTHKK